MAAGEVDLGDRSRRTKADGIRARIDDKSVSIRCASDAEVEVVAGVVDDRFDTCIDRKTLRRSGRSISRCHEPQIAGSVRAASTPARRRIAENLCSRNALVGEAIEYNLAYDVASNETGRRCCCTAGSLHCHFRGSRRRSVTESPCREGCVARALCDGVEWVADARDSGTGSHRTDAHNIRTRVDEQHVRVRLRLDAEVEVVPRLVEDRFVVVECETNRAVRGSRLVGAEEKLRPRKADSDLEAVTSQVVRIDGSPVGVGRAQERPGKRAACRAHLEVDASRCLYAHLRLICRARRLRPDIRSRVGRVDASDGVDGVGRRRRADADTPGRRVHVEDGRARRVLHLERGRAVCGVLREDDTVVADAERRGASVAREENRERRVLVVCDQRSGIAVGRVRRTSGRRNGEQTADRNSSPRSGVCCRADDADVGVIVLRVCSNARRTDVDDRTIGKAKHTNVSVDTGTRLNT